MTPRCPEFIPLHHLLIAQLDLVQGWFLTRELAPLLGISAAQVVKRYRDRVPCEKSAPRRVHRLDFRQAVLLIRAICADGRRLPDRDRLYSRLVENGITANQIRYHASVRAAEAVYEAERQRIMQRAG
jgi:hypothetical protein